MFQSLQPSQPFDINAISRSGLPTMSSAVMRASPMGLSALRTPQMRPALTPSQMAFSRQLSSVTGISIPIATQPGMGIVGRLCMWMSYKYDKAGDQLTAQPTGRQTDQSAITDGQTH